MRITISKASYLGSADFKRASLAFQICGFAPLQEETINGEGTGGGFVMNLIDPYIWSNDLTTQQALAIIEYGLRTSREKLERELANPTLRPTLKDVFGA